MAERFGPEHVEAWRRDGGLVIERFFTEAEVAAVVADFEKVWGRRRPTPRPWTKRRKVRSGGLIRRSSP
uniref:Uncharacterized protein n=1 Tax=Phenylobacterium glaciei TaxID=2803784 RepID=A0A974S9G8_9CAUL|nr:hypothetical protein JKL49_21890 [Phenylobacterium glaciei]